MDPIQQGTLVIPDWVRSLPTLAQQAGQPTDAEKIR
jgi:hypothetical protein